MTHVTSLYLPGAETSDGVEVRVPAVRPGDVGGGGEPGEQVEEGPGAHNHVIHVDIEPHQQHSVAETLRNEALNILSLIHLHRDLECGHHAPKHLVGADPGVLTHAELHEHGGQPHHQQHDHVGDQETGA